MLRFPAITTGKQINTFRIKSFYEINKFFIIPAVIISNCFWSE